MYTLTDIYMAYSAWDYCAFNRITFPQQFPLLFSFQKRYTFSFSFQFPLNSRIKFYFPFTKIIAFRNVTPAVISIVQTPHSTAPT